MPTTGIDDHNDIQLADGVTAYHGSPHEFEEFDPTFIGTGEGAQAYGHGLYFAENEDVAKQYSQNAEGKYDSNRIARSMLSYWGDRDTAIKEQQEHLDRLEGVSASEDFIAPYRKALELLKSGKESKFGHMYEVRLDAQPDNFIDWDKPIANQPRVMKALNQYVDELGGKEELNNFYKQLEEKRRAEQESFSSLWESDEPLDMSYFNNKYTSKEALADLLNDINKGKTISGESFYRALAPQEYDYKGATETAKRLGLHGIKYLDAGSRGQEKGSSNYVVFDPQHIKTVRRYAEGGGIKAFAIGNSIPHLERASDMIDTHDDIQLAPGVEAIEQMPDQAFNSAKTSRNQIPALFNSPAFERNKGSRNLDYGGGAFDKGSEYLAQEHGVDSQVYDPFNRSQEHNDFVLKGFKKEPADTATVANVLNVIAEPEARMHVIKQVHQHIKPDGKAYFTVYEGDGKDKNSGNSRMTRDGWQENRPTHSYVEEIKQVFPDVRLSGKTIIASKKPAKAYGGSIPGPKLTEDNADDFARRLIAWTFATAPLFHRAAGGSVIDDPLDVLSKLRR